MSILYNVYLVLAHVIRKPPIPAVPVLSHMSVYGRGSFIALAASAFMAASESM